MPPVTDVKTNRHCLLGMNEHTLCFHRRHPQVLYKLVLILGDEQPFLGQILQVKNCAYVSYKENNITSIYIYIKNTTEIQMLQKTPKYKRKGISAPYLDSTPPHAVSQRLPYLSLWEVTHLVTVNYIVLPFSLFAFSLSRCGSATCAVLTN